MATYAFHDAVDGPPSHLPSSYAPLGELHVERDYGLARLVASLVVTTA